MKLKNILIVVDDIDRAVEFYKEIFGLYVVLNSDSNVILSEGLVLQDKKVWQETLGKEIESHNNAMELYFEDSDIGKLLGKIENIEETIEFVSKGDEMLRFYDPFGNLIEVRKKQHGI